MDKKVIIALVFFFGFLLTGASASANVFSNGMIISPAQQATTTNSIHTLRSLRRGMYGDDVRELQRTLHTISEIYPSGLVTGYFGSQTEAAVKRLQIKEGIVTSGSLEMTGFGQAGPKTLLFLSLVVLKQNCPNAEGSSRQACLENYYEHYGIMYGVAHALSLLDAQIKHEPLFAGACHAVMHHIAHIAVHEYGTFGEAFLHGNTECQNGYYHGVVEEFLRNENLNTLSAGDIRNFCNQTAHTSSSSTAELNCVHGIGHALVYMTRDDLPRALVRCGDFLDDHLRSQCATGAFMQHTFISATSSSSLETVKNDPAFRCVQMLGNQDECWITLSAIVIGKKENNTSMALQFCHSLASTTYRTKCTEGVTEQGLMQSRAEIAIPKAAPLTPSTK